MKFYFAIFIVLVVHWEYLLNLQNYYSYFFQSFAVLTLQSPQRGDSAGSGCDPSHMKPDALKGLLSKFGEMAKNGGSQFTDMIKQFSTMFQQG